MRPELVAKVKFTGWADFGRIRHAVYLGLRGDKLAGARGRARRGGPGCAAVALSCPAGHDGSQGLACGGAASPACELT